MGDAEDWRERRRADAAAHAEALARREAAEHARARELLRAFVARAKDAGPAPVELVARDEHGRGRYRTGLLGWYLRRDESLAVSTAGDFYVLRAPAGWAARWRGVTLSPHEPPLVLGAGGRDGESVDLAEAIDRVLSGG